MTGKASWETKKSVNQNVLGHRAAINLCAVSKKLLQYLLSPLRWEDTSFQSLQLSWPRLWAMPSRATIRRNWEEWNCDRKMLLLPSSNGVSRRSPVKLVFPVKRPRTWWNTPMEWDWRIVSTSSNPVRNIFPGADGKFEHLTLSVGSSLSVARQRIAGDRTPLEIGRKIHGGRAISNRLLGGRHYGDW